MSTEDNNTAGIRNAEARYKNRVDNLLTSTQLYERARASKTKQKYSGENADASYGNTTKSKSLQLAEARKITEEIFREGGLEYTEGDTELLIKNKPEKPGFPYIMFSIAVVKDVLDFLDLTGFGALLVEFFSIILAIILFVWCYLKTGNGISKQREMQRRIRRLIISMGIELIPFINLIPTATVFVLMTHFRDVKVATTLGNAFTKLKSKGIRV